MDSGLLGAATHAALALAGVYEAKTSKTKTRSFLTGCIIGWHAFAAIYHVVENKKKIDRSTQSC